VWSLTEHLLLLLDTLNGYSQNSRRLMFLRSIDGVSLLALSIASRISVRWLNHYQRFVSLSPGEDSIRYSQTRIASKRSSRRWKGLALSEFLTAGIDQRIDPFGRFASLPKDRMRTQTSAAAAADNPANPRRVIFRDMKS
jgi:hypothetical protein